MHLSIRFSLPSIAAMELKAFGIADVFASIVVNFCSGVFVVGLALWCFLDFIRFCRSVVSDIYILYILRIRD